MSEPGQGDKGVYGEGKGFVLEGSLSWVTKICGGGTQPDVGCQCPSRLRSYPQSKE